MCDIEWENFVASMRRVFPDRPIVEIENPDPSFHVIYDLDQRYQVPGAQYLRSGRTYEQDGVTPRWRGIYDDKGRLMVAICHNMDLGDSWEHDNPHSVRPRVLRARHPHWRQLRNLRNDPLRIRLPARYDGRGAKKPSPV